MFQLEWVFDPIPWTSRREPWFSVCPFVAEFWCTVSNVGFLYVGYKRKNYGIVAAGAASLLCHSYPIKGLLFLDKIGVGIAAFSLCTAWYKKWISMPRRTLIATVGVLSCNVIDFLLSNAFPVLQPWPHVIWHITAAMYSNWILS